MHLQVTWNLTEVVKSISIGKKLAIPIDHSEIEEEVSIRNKDWNTEMLHFIVL